MNVLVTGNNGYIGTVLTQELFEKNYKVVGLDSNYFFDCKLKNFESHHKQIVKDIRQINSDDIKGYDIVIHLAGLANDPLGELDPLLTEKINCLRDAGS